MLFAQLVAPIVVEAFPGDSRAWAVSADGRTAATLASNGVLSLWSVDPDGNAHLARRLRTAPWQGGEEPHTEGMALSPDGSRLAVPRQKGGYEVWSTATPRLVRTIPLPRRADLSPVAWSPKGDALLLGTATGTRLVRIADGAARSVPISPPWAFAPGGSVLGERGNDLVLVDLATGCVRQRFHDATRSEGPFAFSLDGRLLASAGENPAWKGPGESPEGGAPTESAYVHDLLIKVWRVADGKPLRRFYGYSSSDGTPRLRFLDARRLFAPGLGKLFDAPTGRLVKEIHPQEAGGYLPLPPRLAEPLKERVVLWPREPVGGRSVAVSPDGRLAVTNTSERANALLVWDVASRRLLNRVPLRELANLRSLEFTPDGRLVAEGTEPPQPPESEPARRRTELRLDALGRPTGQAVLTASPRPPLAAGIIGSILSKDGTFALAVKLSYHDGASHQDVVRLDPKTGMIEWTGPGPAFPRGGLALSPDGRTFALAWMPRLAPGIQNRLALFDAATGRERLAVDVPSDVWKSTFSTDGRRLFVATRDGIEVRDASTLVVLARTREGQSSGDTQIAGLPDGGFAVARNRQDLRFFDAEARLRATLIAFPGSGWAAWTPGGRVWGSRDGLAHLRRQRGDLLVPVASE